MPETPTPPRGRLYVIAAPSGAGKTSLVKALLERRPELEVSVSYTTRKRRPTEIDGVDYSFVTRERFLELLAEDAFLEHAEVFDNHYGTSRERVARALDAGRSVVLEIDWQGARQVRRHMPDCVTIFILPPSRAELERRLRARRTDDEQVIARRLRDSVEDMRHWPEFAYVIINARFDDALEALERIIDGDGEAYAAGRPEATALATTLLS
jgi:guanylate kinase